MKNKEKNKIYLGATDEKNKIYPAYLNLQNL